MNFVRVLLIFFLFGCQNNKNENIPDICPDNNFSQPLSPASLKNLNEIKELDGRFIQVTGIFRHNFEDVALYTSDRSGSKNALWLNLKIRDSIDLVNLEKMTGKQVSMIGRVNMSRKGHLGSYFGTLDSVFCIKLNR